MPNEIARCKACREDRDNDENSFHVAVPQPVEAADINPLPAALQCGSRHCPLSSLPPTATRWRRRLAESPAAGEESGLQSSSAAHGTVPLFHLPSTLSASSINL